MNLPGSIQIVVDAGYAGGMFRCAPGSRLNSSGHTYRISTTIIGTGKRETTVGLSAPLGRRQTTEAVSRPGRKSINL